MTKSKPTRNWLVLIGFMALSLSAGALGSFYTMLAIPEWYASLARPEFAPPDWLFGPVWTTLYLLMGVAAYLVWSSSARAAARPARRKAALELFLLQLILNAEWSIIFFGLRSPGWALVEIVLLWVAILATLLAFARISRPAAWLLAPYLAWVSFAAYLNYTIWILN